MSISRMSRAGELSYAITPFCPTSADGLQLTVSEWILLAPFFLIFSTIKFVFERSDLGSNLSSRCHACSHQLASHRIIFWKSDAAREKDLIFRD
jgi:hypothetical protein